MIEKSRIEETRKKQNLNDSVKPKDSEKVSNNEKIFIAKKVNPLKFTRDVTIVQNEWLTCLRPMCEHEEGWHLCDSFLILPELMPSFCSYLTRIMKIIQNGTLLNEMQIFLVDQGYKLLSEINSKAVSDENEFIESYTSMLKYFHSELEKDNVRSFKKSDQENSIPLQRCELKNGKNLWLCQKHIEQTNARVVTDSKATGTSTFAAFDQSTNKMLEDLENVSKIDIIF